jgi:hypothetical protein
MEFLRRMVRKNSEAKVAGTGGKKDDPKVHWPTSCLLKFCLT